MQNPSHPKTGYFERKLLSSQGKKVYLRDSAWMAQSVENQSRWTILKWPKQRRVLCWGNPQSACDWPGDQSSTEKKIVHQGWCVHPFKDLSSRPIFDSCKWTDSWSLCSVTFFPPISQPPQKGVLACRLPARTNWVAPAQSWAPHIHTTGDGAFSEIRSKIGRQAVKQSVHTARSLLEKNVQDHLQTQKGVELFLVGLESKISRKKYIVCFGCVHATGLFSGSHLSHCPHQEAIISCKIVPKSRSKIQTRTGTGILLPFPNSRTAPEQWSCLQRKFWPDITEHQKSGCCVKLHGKRTRSKITFIFTLSDLDSLMETQKNSLKTSHRNLSLSSAEEMLTLMWLYTIFSASCTW